MMSESTGTGHKIEIHRSDTANKKLANSIKPTAYSNSTLQPSDEIAAAFIASKEEEAGMEFPDEMTLLQCIGMITKMAVPLIVGMLLFILV